jgi:hypothetical protein
MPNGLMGSSHPFDKDEEKEVPKKDKKKDETPLEVMQRVLAEHGNMESNISVSHPEYWQAKINNNPNK